MKKYLLCALTLILSSCVRHRNSMNDYTYENTHKIDKYLKEVKNEDLCVVIDNSKTKYKKGHENLSNDPFLGKEGYSADSVKKENRKYEIEHFYNECEKPIQITRDIEVSSISYPGTCVMPMYAGSSTFSSNTYYNYYGANTTYTSVPHYNYMPYNCTKTLYLVNILFYKDKTKIGVMKDKVWTEKDPDITIEEFTTQFIQNIEFEVDLEK